MGSQTLNKMEHISVDRAHLREAVRLAQDQDISDHWTATHGFSLAISNCQTKAMGSCPDHIVLFKHRWNYVSSALQYGLFSHKRLYGDDLLQSTPSTIIKMSTTSQKHRNFVAEPMGEKEVTDLAGIGDVLGKRLAGKGFDRAYVVLGQFLLLKKNKDLFVEWLKDLAGANTKQSADCYQCLSDWCDEFL